MRVPTLPSDDTSALIAALWERNRPLVLARLQVLDRTAEVLAEGTLPEELQAEAVSIAHKLAGSLGMFGYPQGTALARELERMLEQDTRPGAAEVRTRAEALRRLLFPSD